MAEGYNSGKDWVGLGRSFRRCRSRSIGILSRCKNMHNILAELVEEDMNFEKRKKSEDLKREVDALEEENKVIEEKYDIESTTAIPMEHLICKLDKDHVRSECKLKAMQIDYNIKMSYKKGMIASKEKNLNVLEAWVYRFSIKNRELHKINKAMEV